MWIHLNRVRSTLSKSVADTSGRFLSHRTERREKRPGEVSPGPDLWLPGPCTWCCLPHGQTGSPTRPSEAQLQDRPRSRLNS